MKPRLTVIASLCPEKMSPSGAVKSQLRLPSMLTWHAAPHIGPQVLSVGAGAGVLGRVLRNLRRLETQVLTASVGHAAQITAVWAWRR